MDGKNELDQLVALNIADLDAVATRIDAIGNRIWKDVSDLASRWAENKAWSGEFTREEIWLAPETWRRDGENWSGWFYFSHGPGDTETFAPGEPYFWLSRYLGEGGGEFCLWLKQDVIKPSVWKPLARTFAPELTEHGTLMSDACNFYWRCSLDRESVAKGLYEGDLSDALQPVEAALEGAFAAHLRIQNLLVKGVAPS